MSGFHMSDTSYSGVSNNIIAVWTNFVFFLNKLECKKKLDFSCDIHKYSLKGIHFKKNKIKWMTRILISFKTLERIYVENFCDFVTLSGWEFQKKIWRNMKEI